MFEITIVKEEMSQSFNVLFAERAKCSSQIADPWYATIKTELAHKYNLNMQSNNRICEMVGRRPEMKGGHICKAKARSMQFRVGFHSSYARLIFQNEGYCLL